MKIIDTIFFNKKYKELLNDNLKSENKWLKLATKTTLFILGGIAFGAYFTGALGFQLIEHDNKRQGFLLAATALTLVFGSLLVAGLGLIRMVDKKFGNKWASFLCFMVFIFAAVTVAAMIMAAIAYVRYH